jgi:hypothetical protein
MAMCPRHLAGIVSQIYFKSHFERKVHAFPNGSGHLPQLVHRDEFEKFLRTFLAEFDQRIYTLTGGACSRDNEQRNWPDRR